MYTVVSACSFAHVAYNKQYNMTTREKRRHVLSAVSARISSLSRVVVAVRGARARLPCAAVGAPPVRRRWAPLPRAHTVTDTGDLIIHS